MTIYDDLVRRRSATPLYDELRRTRPARAATEARTVSVPGTATATAMATTTATALSRRELRALRAAADPAPPVARSSAGRGRRERRPGAALAS